MFSKILAVFLAIFFCVGSAFVFIWADNPDKENKYVQATQGIRLVDNAVFFTATDSTKPNTLHVGDLMMGDQEQIFRINEIRKSQDGSLFVVVSWKYITKYTTYEQYQSQPYTNYSTYELNAFAFNKNLVTSEELESFYDKYSDQIAKINSRRAAVATIVATSSATKPETTATKIAPQTGNIPAPPPPAALAAAPTPAAKAAVVERAIIQGDVSAIDDKRNTAHQEVQSYSSAEISQPENLDREALDRTVEQNADIQMQQNDGDK